MGISIRNEIATVCVDCIKKLCNKKLEIDMFKLDTKECDVIQCMTWPSTYGASIDYQS